MAYNPFDDVIENDPAYMANGGELINADEDPSTKILDITLQVPRPTPTPTPPVPDFISQGRQIRDKQEKLQKLKDSYGQSAFTQSMQPVYEQRQQEDFSDVQQTIASGVAPIFEGIAASETADRGKAKKEKNEQIKQQLGFGNRNQLSKLQMEQAKQYGYEPLTIGETFAAIPDFLYGDQAESFRKLANGEQLEEGDKFNILLSPLDALDFLGVGVASGAVFKLLKRLKDKYKVPNLQKILDNPAFAGDGDVEEARQIVMGAAPPQGLPIEQGGRGQTVMFDKPDVPGGSTPSKVTNYQRTREYLETITEPQTTKQISDATGLSASAIQDFKQAYAQDPITQKIRVRDPKQFPEDRLMQKGASTQRITEFLNNQKEPLTQQQIADAVGIKKSQVAEYKYKLDKNSPLLKLFRSDKREGQDELIKDFFQKNPNATFKDKKEFADKYNFGRTKLKTFLRENPQYSKHFEKVGKYVISQGNAALADVLRTSNKTLDQKLTQLEEFIATDNEQPVSTLFKKFGFGDRDPQTNTPLMSKTTFEQYMRNQKGYVSQKQSQRSLFQDYFPQSYGMSKSDKARADITMSRDFFRSDFFKDNNDFVSVMKGFGIEPKTLTDEAGKKIPNPNWNAATNKINKQNFYNAQASILTQKNGYDKLLKKATDANALSRDVSQQFYDSLKNNEGFRNQFISEYNRVFPKGAPAHVPDNNWEEMYKKYKSQFTAQLAHITPLKDFKKMEGFKGMGAEPDLLTINFGAHNIAVQPRIENVIKDAVRNINQGRDLEKNLTRLRNANSYMVNNNMRTYLRFTDRTMSDETLKKLQDDLSSVYIGKDNNQKTIFLGRDEEMTLDEMKSLFREKMLLYTADPKSFKISTGKPLGAKMEDEMLITGSAPYIKKGAPLNFKKGGPVRMAMGGDPLQNINQQQFSPDPAVDQDYFQEAVDSGNLQAANLFNLFKVFNKPKAMATPSNVKQVEEARDPIPAPTGSQEIAPMPAGRQDFFFKSYFLDQLNSQNAPKASTPQGWREFLIKGRKVPEAEMMDTGILQYLEDTEKFFPNKKITKQDLESLYDTSPLGNLEVRVKEIKAPGFDEGQFTLDQGRPRHKGAGNAAIDQAADDYFEVVVNVPQLPGQEKVFVNSGHFSEPNVLGFTRVGTYKNADNQKVAVIQEMQTDMLTEVRKEQERLFAMVNALKRQRADLARQVEQARNLGPGNVEYATNKLRQFDQKYPESLLNDLAQDNLIQPFPNIVAKELIPEKTRNLNAIQEDINKLSMANVEQYTDPAYKTKIFDLAQEQTKILDDLMSMNRSSNYQEKLQDFKVPSTSDRDELTRIGQTDTYLPSDYNMKKLESFPPIPFNKQADYVDLLIKSTIKAAKQKGIDRVAIMPADIGANPRWGKSSDEAKKKFQNLYDKVGVQQLKNIAKKYDGTLNVEKIIDPSKTNRGLTFLSKSPDGEFQFLKQTETKKNVSDAERDAFYDTEITRIAKDVNEPGDIVIQREIAPGQMMDYYVVEGRGDATDVGYRMIPLKENESADNAIIKIVEYNPSAIDMYTISFDPSKLEEPMYLFKKKSGGTIDKDSLVSITDIYGEYGR